VYLCTPPIILVLCEQKQRERMDHKCIQQAQPSLPFLSLRLCRGCQCQCTPGACDPPTHPPARKAPGPRMRRASAAPSQMRASMGLTGTPGAMAHLQRAGIISANNGLPPADTSQLLTDGLRQDMPSKICNCQAVADQSLACPLVEVSPVLESLRPLLHECRYQHIPGGADVIRL
jgi:hypothetical protein